MSYGAAERPLHGEKNLRDSANLAIQTSPTPQIPCLTIIALGHLDDSGLACSRGVTGRSGTMAGRSFGMEPSSWR